MFTQIEIDTAIGLIPASDEFMTSFDWSGFFAWYKPAGVPSSIGPTVDEEAALAADPHIEPEPDAQPEPGMTDEESAALADYTLAVFEQYGHLDNWTDWLVL